MPTKTTPEFKEDPEELRVDWLSDLSKISLLAEFIEMAFKEGCDCKVCKRLRERAQAFINLTRQLPKM
jgi:hypothetical protein